VESSENYTILVTSTSVKLMLLNIDAVVIPAY